MMLECKLIAGCHKMPFEKQVGVRGKVVTAQTREVIANVLKFMKKEAENGAPVIPITNYKQRLKEATGASERIYKQVVKDMKLIEAGKITAFTSPNRKSRSNCVIEIVEVKREEEDYSDHDMYMNDDPV
jgi:hypothetical protein